MISIPGSLMLSPPNAYANPEIGTILLLNKDILKGFILIHLNIYLLVFILLNYI